MYMSQSGVSVALGNVTYFGWDRLMADDLFKLIMGLRSTLRPGVIEPVSKVTMHSYRLSCDRQTCRGMVSFVSFIFRINQANLYI